ncbi:hypothetical protein [uncultured Chryseobacterium sp.]|uniref:hypothetical protein n=1 Tax=uncultured Chryseobacterium sp. TaxID=259322 RepID=UPI002611C3A1|nr:hypothetical protein [uncultured Chryseobacterium sp.]
MSDKFLVYENWRADDKAVVHKETCGHAIDGNTRIENKWLSNNPATNDRWFGYFNTFEEAVAFAALLPKRQLRICSHCLKMQKQKF